MILQLLLELLGMAPQLIQDGEQVVNHLNAAPNAAAKAQAVAAGIDHLVATVAPALGSVGK